MDEIAFVKQLYADAQKNNNELQFVVNGQPMLVVPTMIGAKKQRGSRCMWRNGNVGLLLKNVIVCTVGRICSRLRSTNLCKNMMMAQILRNSVFLFQKRVETL